jgi:putative nucleotidyltransferase with HDIG domain
MVPFALISLVLEPPMSALDVIVRVVGCFVSGALSSLFAVMLTPIVEYFGGYASDMRLIEMATLDHPLLKELSIQAPGTWNHSMVIGMMVESAADAIGANPVVCRVGAYFHDIGKSKKPLYFVENQTPGDNRHDKLSPSMSALIIRAHVKDGVELVRRHNLPKVVEEMIPQHHGTAVIDYFYEKARKEAEELGQDPEAVDRSLYQYPGPKPQTREAGLLMLADGIEAAARTLSEPTQDRIRGLVQKMLNKVFASGELNECDLTLQDLHIIAKCFTRVLTGIYHQRIAYAEPVEKSAGGNEAREGARADDGSERPRENLRRLGIE